MFLAAFPPILLLSRVSSIRLKVFCNPSVILIAPAVCTLFLPRYNSCSLVLCSKIALMAFVASSVMLLSLKLITMRFEVLCKPSVILLIPTVCKLLLPRRSFRSLVVLDKIAAMSSAISIWKLLSLNVIFSISQKIFCKLTVVCSVNGTTFR